jgi:hypothetical protein
LKKDKYIGTIINNYKILERIFIKSKDGHAIYKARCIKCGYIKYDRISNFKRYNVGNICNHFEKKAHWYSDRLEKIFRNMLSRCTNKNCKDYNFYGARGIHICDEWIDNPQSFNDWAIQNGYKENLTIDRINENKDYCPENCRWITREQNSKWKSTTSKITVDGISDSGRGWAKRLHIGTNQINRWKREKGLEFCENKIRVLLNNK